MALPQQLAQDPRFVGGRIGMVGVLHTWTCDLRYHSHVRYLVPANALAPDGQRWLPASQDFLLHAKPLSILFRAKFRDALKKTAWFDLVPAKTWKKDWVVDCQPVGSGVAALKSYSMQAPKLRTLESGEQLWYIVRCDFLPKSVESAMGTCFARLQSEFTEA